MNLTREQIEAMEAGPEMDALVAEHVMGWRKDGIAWVDADGKCKASATTSALRCPGGGMWHPSTDIAAAWEVVEAGDNPPETGKRWYYKLDSIICGGWVCAIHDELACVGGVPGKDFDWLGNVTADTAPLAICRAALLAFVAKAEPIHA